MKEEIKERYNKIQKLLEEVNLEQYSDPKALDEFDEVVELLKDIKPLIIDLRAFESMLREDIERCPEVLEKSVPSAQHQSFEAGYMKSKFEPSL